MDRTNRIVVAVLAVSLVFAGAVGAVLFLSNDSGISPQTVHAQERLQNRGISVQGEGQISVAPDVANVVLGVELEGSDLDSMRDDADARMNEVIDALIELGIAEDDIQTTTYDIRIRDHRDWPVPPPMPVPEPAEPDEPVSDEADDAVTDDAEDAVTDEEDDDAVTDEDDDTVTDDADDTATDAEDAPVTTEPAMPGEGQEPDQDVATYRILQQVQVRVPDIDMVGDVIDTALDSGANRVASIWFEVEDRQQAIDQAREEAVNHALQKAEHLAELTGVSLGPPLYIDEWSPSGPPIPAAEFAMDDAAADTDAAMARIQPGESVITVTVNITYDIE